MAEGAAHFIGAFTAKQENSTTIQKGCIIFANTGESSNNKKRKTDSNHRWLLEIVRGAAYLSPCSP